MSPDDRLERLERRLHELEEMVLDLQAELRATQPAPAPPPPPQTIARRVPEMTPVPRRPAVKTPQAPADHSSANVRPATRRLAVGTEQWFGQRGLLAAGVFLLILAAGYFLKLAFDRGWISPLLRCTGGGVLGLAVAGAGWRLHHRGLRTYGAALMGCGAAIAYLAVWAAVRFYDLLPATVGLGMMALLSVGTFGTAWAVNVEELAAAAALGAFLAPMVVGRSGNPNVLLLYSFFLAAGLGGVALNRWRLTTFLIGLSFFTLGVAASLSPAIVRANALMYGVVGAGVGLGIGLRRRWTETRFLSFFGGWMMLWMAALHPNEPGRLIAAGGVILAGVIWWHAWRGPAVWPDAAGDDALRAESLYFYATPLWLLWAIPLAAPAWFARWDWVTPFIIALCYLAAGYVRPRVPFAIVGTTAALLSVLVAWGGVPAVWAALALSLLWAGLDHRLERIDGRWYALLAAATALGHLIAVDLPARASTGRAFVDAWALSLWLATGAVAILAAALWRRLAAPSAATVTRAHARYGRSDWEDIPVEAMIPAALWVVAGSLLFWGVTNELTRFFQQTTLTPATARLASGLAVSAWWALFAGSLVMVGFQRKLKPVRVAGLIVSSLAVAKVLLFDLSELDALYRIASVFILGLVSLGAAYLYHRQAAGLESTAAGDDPAPPAP